MKFVATKTADQLDLQALHRVRERLVSQRTGIINQIRAFLLERGVAIRQGLRFLRAELPRVLAKPSDVLSARMVHVIESLTEDWRRLDERIDQLSGDIAALARQDAGCERLRASLALARLSQALWWPQSEPARSFPKAATLRLGSAWCPNRSPRAIAPSSARYRKRGNRYLRVLFVQAAWVVPDQTEELGSARA